MRQKEAAKSDELLFTRSLRRKGRKNGTSITPNAYFCSNITFYPDTDLI